MKTTLSEGEAIARHMRANSRSSNKEPDLSPGDAVRIALESTGSAVLTITHTGFTAEVNGAQREDNGDGTWGKQITEEAHVLHTSRRVPAALAMDTAGHPHAIFFWYDTWVGAWHRNIQFSRDWETLDGSDLPPDLAAAADAALRTNPSRR